MQEEKTCDGKGIACLIGALLWLLAAARLISMENNYCVGAGGIMMIALMVCVIKYAKPVREFCRKIGVPMRE